MSFSVVILHNGKQHTIDLVSDGKLTVGDLTNAVEKEFDIHRSRQRLIFRGKSLIDEDAEVSSIGIKNGSKIMLIGRKEVADPTEIKKLNELEVSLTAIQTRFASLKSASDCNTSSTADSFRKNQMKDIIAVIEACMRDLEKADSVVLPAGDEKERKRRKDLVNSLNDLIISAEQLHSELDCVCNDSPIADSSK